MNKIILNTLNREIFFISIVIVVSLFGLSYVIALNMLSPDMKTPSTISPTSDGKVTDANLTAQNAQISTALEESENIGGISSVSNKCLGSALCPD